MILLSPLPNPKSIHPVHPVCPAAFAFVHFVSFVVSSLPCSPLSAPSAVSLRASAIPNRKSEIGTSCPSHSSCELRLRALRVLRGSIPPLLSALSAVSAFPRSQIQDRQSAIVNPPPGPSSQQVNFAHLFLLQGITSRIQPPKRPEKAHFFALPYFYIHPIATLCPLRALRVLRGYTFPLLCALRALCGFSSRIRDRQSPIQNRQSAIADPELAHPIHPVHPVRTSLLSSVPFVSSVVYPFFFFPQRSSACPLPPSLALAPGRAARGAPRLAMRHGHSGFSSIRVHPPARARARCAGQVRFFSTYRKAQYFPRPGRSSAVSSSSSRSSRLRERLSASSSQRSPRFPMPCTISLPSASDAMYSLVGWHSYLWSVHRPWSGVRTVPPHTKHPSPPRFHADSLSVENRLISRVVYPTTNTRET